jgi:hypothetical protein
VKIKMGFTDPSSGFFKHGTEFRKLKKRVKSNPCEYAVHDECFPDLIEVIVHWRLAGFPVMATPKLKDQGKVGLMAFYMGKWF